MHAAMADDGCHSRSVRVASLGQGGGRPAGTQVGLEAGRPVRTASQPGRPPAATATQLASHSQPARQECVAVTRGRTASQPSRRPRTGRPASAHTHV